MLSIPLNCRLAILLSCIWKNVIANITPDSLMFVFLLLGSKEGIIWMWPVTWITINIANTLGTINVTRFQMESCKEAIRQDPTKSTFRCPLCSLRVPEHIWSPMECRNVYIQNAMRSILSMILFKLCSQLNETAEICVRVNIIHPLSYKLLFSKCNKEFNWCK